MNITYTGTQQGMSEAQMLALRGLIPRNCKFRHGDCVGGDAQAHVIAVDHRCQIYIHPCTIENKRAHCASGIVTIYPARPALVRNRDMVADSQWLIATPFQDQEVLRSGTWSTIRYAMKHRQTFDGAYRITHIKRDGTVCEL